MADTSATKSENTSATRLLELIQMRLISEAIYVVAALGIPDLLAAAPKNSNELAQAIAVSPPHLHRVLRALTRFGLFSEDNAGRFTLSPMGEHLRRDADGSLHWAAMLFGNGDGARMLELFLDCVTQGKSASEIRFGNWTTWIQNDPELLSIFNAMMTAFSKIHLTGVLDAYDFSYVTKLVDIGGGHGRILTEILKRNPRMHGVLFDLAHALEGGKEAVAGAGLGDRCEVISGDFFVSVPAGGDMYLLSRVIHDWNDADSIAVLKVIRKSITPDGRVVLLENMLLPAGKSLYPVLSDLNMLIRTGGSERTEAEYRALYRAAGFELTRTVETAAPTGTTVIEGRPV
jgi:SAM-dependent methyltransferase